jgi:NADPH-dependent 2,4-dienoyl-CoA reductase/sulfur reductase-like enzyme
MSETYELAVIGAGPAGMEAALAASEAGVKTVLIDGLPREGGQYYRKLPVSFSAHRRTDTEKEGDLLSRRLAEAPVTRISNALTWGIFKEEKGEGWQVALSGVHAPPWVHTRTLILANGAYDRPVAFPGWTLPGVITSGAALILVKSQRVAPGQRALVAGTGPLLLSSAAHLIEAGVEVVGVCEANRPISRGILLAPILAGQVRRVQEAAQYLTLLSRKRVPYRTGWSILEARGKEHIEEVVITKLDSSGSPLPGSTRIERVDTVVCGFGLIPNTGLARMIGCRMEYQAKKGGWVPVRDSMLQTSLPGVYMAGDGAGICGAENARLEGRLAGAAVALQTGHMNSHDAGRRFARVTPGLSRERRFGRLLGDLFPPQPGWISLARDETLLCRCEEVSLREVKAAVAEGARTLGEVKMVTRAGMGNCQGRMCECAVAGAILQALAQEGADLDSVGMYSIRPPLQPLPLGFLAQAGQNDSGE